MMVDYRTCIAPIDHTYKPPMVYTGAPPFVPNTLCWCCLYSNDSCSWHAEEHRPVPGWDAVRRDMLVVDNSPSRTVRRYTESYVVLRCPQFLLNPRFAEEYKLFDPEKARRKALEKMDRSEDAKITQDELCHAECMATYKEEASYVR